MSRALFGNDFRIRNRRNEAAERRPINFKFFNGVEVFSGLGVDLSLVEDWLHSLQMAIEIELFVH